MDYSPAFVACPSANLPLWLVLFRTAGLLPKLYAELSSATIKSLWVSLACGGRRHEELSEERKALIIICDLRRCYQSNIDAIAKSVADSQR